MADQPFDALAYWERRHAALPDDYRSVGNRKLTSEQNFDLMVTKAIIVAQALGASLVPRGARILDAGCGAGAFTELLQRAGYEMTGIDGSASAIGFAQQTSSARFDVSPISRFEPDVPFDAVLCLDVLFHVIDDDEWEQTLDSLLACVRPGGPLVILEFFGDFGESTAQHVRWRSLAAYAAFLEKRSAAITSRADFRYPGQDKVKTLFTVVKA